MNKCSKCNNNPVVVGTSSKCPKCDKEVCNHCLVQSCNKCPHCGHTHMIRKGGIEDKQKN